MIPENPCGFLIKQINDALEKQANNALREQGLTMVQVTVLLYLNDQANKQANLKEIEKFLHVAQSTSAGVVTRLEQKGLLESYTNTTDKRIKTVRLTKAGLECCINSRDNLENAEKMLMSGLTSKDQESLRKLLLKVSKNVK